MMVAVVLADVRRDLALAPLAHGPLEQAVLFTQGEIDHAGSQQRSTQNPQTPCGSACSASSVVAKQEILSRAAGDMHRRGAAEIERRRRARAVRRDLEMIGAAEERDDLAERRVCVSRHL